MKKRIFTTVLLVVCMVLTTLLATSCGGGASELDAFEAAIENTTPANIDGKITVYTAAGALELEYSAVIEDGGKFTVNYEYTNFNDIATGNAGALQGANSGTVTYDGSKFSDESIAGKIAATAIKLDLGADMEYSVSSDGKVLSATVAAENTEDVFGIAYSADVRFVLSQSGEKILSLVLEYTLESGELVKAECSYK